MTNQGKQDSRSSPMQDDKPRTAASKDSKANRGEQEKGSSSVKRTSSTKGGVMEDRGDAGGQPKKNR